MVYTTHPRYFPEKTIELGTFNVDSGKLVVSDPCYSPGTWCAGALGNVKNGIWKGFVQKGKTDWGNRCWSVQAVHLDHYSQNMGFSEKTDITVGVDSGQAGIYDVAKFGGGQDEYGDGGWYDNACETTLSALGAGVLDGGVVSSSGFGDGAYDCYVSRDNSGQIVGVKVVFIRIEDFIEDYDDFEQDDEEFDDDM